MKNKPRRLVLYGLIVCIRACVYLLPRKLVVFLGACLGSLVYYLVKKERQKALDGLNFVFKDEKSTGEIRKIAVECFKNLGRNLAEFLIMDRFTLEQLKSFVSVDGFEKVEPFLKDKKGFLVVSAHIGNWELLAGYFGRNGYAPTVVGKKIYYEKYNDFLVNIRTNMGVSTVYRDGALRSIVKILRGGSFVCILADQDVDSIDGVFVDFLGKKAYTPSGPALIAMAVNVPIVPVFILRDGYNHRIVIDDVITPVKSQNKENDVLENTRAWNNVVQKYVMNYPQQWVWVHKRWKTKEVNISEKEGV